MQPQKFQLLLLLLLLMALHVAGTKGGSSPLCNGLQQLNDSSADPRATLMTAAHLPSWLLNFVNNHVKHCS